MKETFKKFIRLLDSATRNLSQAFYDQYVEINAEFRTRAGLETIIFRDELGDCCDWCKDLAGTYTYENKPENVFARHANCRCIVTTRTKKGPWKDAWSKKEYKRFRDNRIAREKEIESEIASRRVKGQNTDSSKGFYDGLTRKEMAVRAKAGKRDPNNRGIIADKILNGEYSLRMKEEKYKQHIFGSEQYKRAEKSRGRKQSYLTITKEEAQKAIYDFAGKGKADEIFSGREFIDYNKVIGYYHEGNIPKETKRFMIIHSKDGAHIVPVKRI